MVEVEGFHIWSIACDRGVIRITADSTTHLHANRLLSKDYVFYFCL